MHVHVRSPEGEAKFWIEPGIELAANFGFTEREVVRIGRILEERQDEVRQAWRRHFTG